MHCDIFFFHVISSSRCASFLISSYRRGKRQKAKHVKSNLSPTRYCHSSNRLNMRTPQGKKREQLIKLLTVCGFKIATGPIRVRRRALIHTQNLKVSESYKFGGDNNVSQSYCLVSQLSSFHLRLSLSLSLFLSLSAAPRVYSYEDNQAAAPAPAGAPSLNCTFSTVL
jgi:hypothetical protein